MRVLYISFLLLTANIVAALPDPEHSNSRKAPGTVVIDGYRLVDAEVRLNRGDRSLKSSLDSLVAHADSWLNQGPWTVTSKTKAPPNGTIHDYASQAPYWWPNSNTPDSCPYIQKDGMRNPEVDNYPDKINSIKLFNSIYTLSLA
ncbi:uncharacterized protein N7458_001065 [Penicillium daleae]|uniref:Alginate lyase domain-containing protein n=1 Tax=Penicillium daleae TaxID=63821 RepID=A0AAD6CC08_9EURO|nr:uncharacterized protein N7458_001065 [Penicillium daleae]KAJ5459513.1 hypothetical protein N7458_001065 [Penicillium daleae]